VNLRTASFRFSLFLALGISILVFFFCFERSSSLKTALDVVYCFALLLLLWPFILWLIRIVLRRMKPMSLLDKHGTMLYRLKDCQIEFVGSFLKRDALDEIAIEQLNQEFISFPVVLEINKEKVFNLSKKSDNKKVLFLPFETKIILKVEKLFFYFPDFSRGREAGDFVRRYGYRQNLEVIFSGVVDKAFQETFKSVVGAIVSNNINEELTLSANNFDFKKVFIEKLQIVLKKEFYKLQTNSDFDFSLIFKKPKAE
jgi:hypothetical protein